MCTILPPEFFSLGTSGIPAPSIEIKLRDVPEAGYLTSASPPRGEILLRGPSVTPGYYRRPDLNADPAIFTPDGWFRTGDVGMWNADGTLSIIDRCARPHEYRLSILTPLTSSPVLGSRTWSSSRAERYVAHAVQLYSTHPPNHPVCRPRTARSDLPHLVARVQHLHTRNLARKAANRDHLPARGEPRVRHPCCNRDAPPRPSVGHPSPLCLPRGAGPPAQGSPIPRKKGESKGDRGRPGRRSDARRVDAGIGLADRCAKGPKKGHRECVQGPDRGAFVHPSTPSDPWLICRWR